MNSSAGNSSTEDIDAQAGSSQEPPRVSSTRFQYQVRHGLLKWWIENFSSFPDADDKYGLSPIFDLKETWWCLALHPKVKIFGRDKISLNLIRHKSDPGPENVTASYRLGLESGQNKVWFEAEESIVFGKGDCYGFQTSVLGHLEDFLTEGTENNNDALSVLCEMYVVYKISMNISSSSSWNLNVDSDLSLNLLKLFYSEKRYDVLIEIPKLRVRAHKCVLSARSKTLARTFEDDKAFIQFSCTPSCLYCVLYYMYSGSFIFLAKNAVFSIGLYELACELSLSELKELLTPYKIELKSRIVVDECKIACLLHDFSITDISTGKMESRLYVDSETGINVQICVQQTTSLDYLEFLVKVSGIAEALHFSFQLYILNKNCEPAEIITGTFLPNLYTTVCRNLVFTYPVYFSVSDIMRCSSSDGNFHLNFACKRYLLKNLSDIASNDNEDLILPRDHFNTWFLNLGEDLTTLFYTGYLSDIILVAFERQFKVHSSILGARSEYFDKLFSYYLRKNVVIEVTNVDPCCLELALLYIYSGEIKYKNDVTNFDILDLYKSGVWLKINSLKRKCSKYLARNLDRFSVFDILSCAERYKNSYLISACNNYIIKYQLSDVITPSSSSRSSSSAELKEGESGEESSSENLDGESEDESSSFEKSDEKLLKKETSYEKSEEDLGKESSSEKSRGEESKRTSSSYEKLTEKSKKESLPKKSEEEQLEKESSSEKSEGEPGEESYS